MKYFGNASSVHRLAITFLSEGSDDRARPGSQSVDVLWTSKQQSVNDICKEVLQKLAEELSELPAKKLDIALVYR